MAGMSNSGVAAISDYGSRTLELTVTGVCNQAVMKTSHYRLKVPYSRLSQTMQTIQRMGGTITRVTQLPDTSTEETASKTASTDE